MAPDEAAGEATHRPGLRTTEAREHPMLDVIVLAIGLGLFALSVGYAYGCERL